VPTFHDSEGSQAWRNIRVLIEIDDSGSATLATWDTASTTPRPRRSRRRRPAGAGVWPHRINAAQAAEVVRQLEPRFVCPCTTRFRLKLQLDPLDRF